MRYNCPSSKDTCHYCPVSSSFLEYNLNFFQIVTTKVRWHGTMSSSKNCRKTLWWQRSASSNVYLSWLKNLIWMGTCSPGHFAQIRVLELGALKTRSRKFHRHPLSVFTRSFSSRFDLTSQPDWLARMKGDDGEIIENPEYAINCPLVDLANHGTNIKLLCWSGYDNNSKKMHLKTHKKIKQGTELCINYGFGKLMNFRFIFIPYLI